MDVREKLVATLKRTDREVYEALKDREDYREEMLWDYFASNLIAHGVTAQEWISVKDRLPEIVSTHKRYRSTIKKSIRVLCVCVQKDGKTMVKEGYCELWDDYPEPIWKIPGTIDSVTHWMPLPQPPKGE